MPNVTAGYYADFVKQIKALTEQLLLKICSVKMAVPCEAMTPRGAAYWRLASCRTYVRCTNTLTRLEEPHKHVWWVQVLGHHGCRTAQAVMGHDSLPHAATGVFDTAGCRTTSFHDARVVGGRGGLKEGVTRTTRARGGGEWLRG